MPRLELRFLSKDDVERLALPATDVLRVVEAGLRAHGEGRVVMPPKDHLSLDDRYRGHFNILKGYVEDLDLAGVKVIGDYVDNYRVGLPSEVALLTLYDARTGVPLAIVDATLLTWMRTGAVSAIGARHLARPDSRVLAHVGARGTAGYNLRYIDALFRLDEIRLASRRAESRERLVAELAAELATPVRACATVEEAVRGADIVVDASRLAEPDVLVRREWLAPGALVMPYGAVRSTEPDLPLAADKFVVDDWRQATHSRWGQYYELIEDGTLREEHVHAEIGQVVAGLRPGREHDDELIVFWHRGFAISDIVVGHLALERARAAGVGTVLVHVADARPV